MYKEWKQTHCIPYFCFTRNFDFKKKENFSKQLMFHKAASFDDSNWFIHRGVPRYAIFISTLQQVYVLCWKVEDCSGFVRCSPLFHLPPEVLLLGDLQRESKGITILIFLQERMTCRKECMQVPYKFSILDTFGFLNLNWNLHRIRKVCMVLKTLQEAHGPYCSPEKQFQSIYTFAQ